MWTEIDADYEEVQRGTYTVEGIKAVAEALRVSGSLKSADIGHNNIGKEAALSLVSIFKERDQMQSVGLAGCDLGVDGAKAVADYVSVSASVTSVCAPPELQPTRSS